MTLVGAGAALDAGVEKYLEAAVFLRQFPHLVDGDLFPVVDQFTRKSQIVLKFLLGDERLAVRHHAFVNMRNDGEFFQFRCFEISHACLLVQSFTCYPVRPPTVRDDAVHAGCRPGCGSG